MDFMKTMQEEKDQEKAVVAPVTTEGLIPEGERNSTMYRYACRVLARLRDTDKAYQEFLQKSASCSPLLDEKELDSIWESALKFYQEKVQPKVVEEWEPLIPFQKINTPDFPTDCLPAPVASFVKALAESTQTPEEMAGILSLGILATAFQSRYSVEVKPDWHEPLCLYTVAIAPPGERKSTVISALSSPVYDYEKRRQEAEAAEVKMNQDKRDTLEKRLQYLKGQAVKKTGSGFEEIGELSAQLAEFEDKYSFRLLVDDSDRRKRCALPLPPRPPYAPGFPPQRGRGCFHKW